MEMQEIFNRRKLIANIKVSYRYTQRYYFSVLKYFLNLGYYLAVY